MNPLMPQGRLIRQRVSSLPHQSQLSTQKITAVISPWPQQVKLQQPISEDPSLYSNLKRLQLQQLQQSLQSHLQQTKQKLPSISSELVHKPLYPERSSPYQSTKNLNGLIPPSQLRPRSNSQPQGIRLLSAYQQIPPGEFNSTQPRYLKDDSLGSTSNPQLISYTTGQQFTQFVNTIPQPQPIYRSKQQSSQILIGIGSTNNSPQQIRGIQQQSPYQANQKAASSHTGNITQDQLNPQYQAHNYFIPSSTFTFQPTDNGINLPFPPLPPQPTTGNSSLFRTASSKAPRKFDNSSLHFQYSHSPSSYPIGFEDAPQNQKVFEHSQPDQVGRTSVRSIDEFMGASFSEQEQVFGKPRQNTNYNQNQTETRQSQMSQIYPSPFNISSIQPKGIIDNSMNQATNRFEDFQNNPISKFRGQNIILNGQDRLHSFSRDFQNFQMTSPNQSAVGVQNQNDNGSSDSVIFDGTSYHPNHHLGNVQPEFRESEYGEEDQGKESVNMISQSISYRQMFLTSLNGKNVETPPVMHSGISEKDRFHQILQEKDKSIDNLKKQLEKAVSNKYQSNEKENRYNSIFEQLKEGYSSRSVNHQCDGWKIKVVDVDESAKSKVILLEIELKNQKKQNEEQLKQISILQDEITLRNRSLEIITLDNAHLNEALSDLSSELRKRENEIENSKKEALFNSRIARLQDEKNNSFQIDQQKYDNLIQENLRLKAIVKDRDISQIEQESKIDSLTYQLSLTKNHLNESPSNDAKSDKEQIKILEKQIADLIQNLNEISSELQLANASLAEKSNQIEAIEEDFQRQMSQKQNELQFIKTSPFGEDRIAELSERIRVLEEEKILFQNEVSQFEELHEKVTQQVQLLQQENEAKDEENRNHITEVNNLKNNILDLESSNLQVRRQKNVLESQVESLRAQERETTTLNEALQENIQKRQLAFQQVETDCERLKIDNRLLQRSLGITDHQLEEQRGDQKLFKKPLLSSPSRLA